MGESVTGNNTFDFPCVLRDAGSRRQGPGRRVRAAAARRRGPTCRLCP